MTEQLISADGAELCLETFGDPGEPALLLIAGTGMSMDYWEPEFCRRLAGPGRFVIRYDHRDTGRSSTSPPGEPDYTSNELFTDPVRILDALDIERAHLAGLSMGGAIAQVVTHLHPERVRTLVLMSTSPAGDRTSTEPLPRPEPRLRQLFENPPPEPDRADRAAVLDHIVEDFRAYAGSLGFDAARIRRITETVLERSRDIDSRTNHGCLSGESPSFRMADITVPTLVLHGTDDPLFPLPHGEALAADIPCARLVPLPGMGHEVPPPQLWDQVVEQIARHTA